MGVKVIDFIKEQYETNPDWEPKTQVDRVVVKRLLKQGIVKGSKIKKDAKAIKKTTKKKIVSKKK
jgi:hypothetical protein